MNKDRRHFILSSAGASALLLGGTVTLEGCGVLSDLETWVPVALSAFDGVVSIIAPYVGPAGAALDSNLR